MRARLGNLLPRPLLMRPFLIGYLTPEEYFILLGNYVAEQGGCRHMLAGFEDFFSMGKSWARKKYLRDLSKGNQKKVGIVAVFIGDPRR